jgi:methenyltetrahydromethanopterin cyclohydrolase
MNIYKGLLFLHGHLIHAEDERDDTIERIPAVASAPLSKPFAQAANPYASSPCPTR